MSFFSKDEKLFLAPCKFPIDEIVRLIRGKAQSSEFFDSFFYFFQSNRRDIIGMKKGFLEFINGSIQAGGEHEGC